MHKCFTIVLFLMCHFFLYSNDLHKFKTQTEKYGFVNKNLKVVISPIYDEVENFGTDGYSVVTKREGISVINEKGNVIDPILTDKLILYRLVDNVFYNNWDNYVYNVNTKKVDTWINPKAMKHYIHGGSCTYPFYDEKEETEKYISVNSKGEKTIINCELRECYPFVNEFAFAQNNEWEGIIINKDGRIILDKVYNSGYNPSEGLLPVITKEKNGFINSKGQFVFLQDFYVDDDSFIPGLDCFFSEGIVVVQKKKGIYDIRDNTGEYILKDFKLFYCAQCMDDFILCQKEQNGKYGYMNKKGILVADFIFDYAESFENGYAVIKYLNEYGLLDKNGNVFLSKDLLEGKKKVFKNIFNNK